MRSLKTWSDWYKILLFFFAIALPIFFKAIVPLARGRKKKRCACVGPCSVCVWLVYLLFYLRRPKPPLVSKSLMSPETLAKRHGTLSAANMEPDLCALPYLKKIHCGKTGCGWMLTWGTTTFIRKEYHPRWVKQLKMTVEVYKRLDKRCPGIVYPIQICRTGIIYPYDSSNSFFVNAYNDIPLNTSATNMTFLHFTQMMNFAFYNMSRCIATRGLVMFDITAQHMILDEAISAHSPFQIFDVDLWRRREWYGSTIPKAQQQNKYLFKQVFAYAALFHGYSEQAQFKSLQLSIVDLQWDQISCCWWNAHSEPWKYMMAAFPEK